MAEETKFTKEEMKIISEIQEKSYNKSSDKLV